MNRTKFGAWRGDDDNGRIKTRSPVCLSKTKDFKWPSTAAPLSATCTHPSCYRALTVSSPTGEGW